MISLVLCGGLGNQLFQYASAKAIAMMVGAVLYIDVSYYSKHFKRNYMLNHFAIEEKFLNEKYFNFALANPENDVIFLKEAIPTYDKDLANKVRRNIEYGNNVRLRGYMQSMLYFEQYNNVIMQHFKIKTKPSSNAEKYIKMILKCSESTSIHVRRTDYIDVNRMEKNIILNKSYYIMAVEYILKKLKSPTFFIFSDDIIWCKANISTLIPRGGGV